MRVNFPGGVEKERTLSADLYRERGMSSRWLWPICRAWLSHVCVEDMSRSLHHSPPQSWRRDRRKMLGHV